MDLGSMRIRNCTKFGLTIQLSQVGVLYHGYCAPGEEFFRETGAVHFTIRVRLNKTGKDDTKILIEAVLPVVATVFTAVGIAASLGCGIVVLGIEATAAAGAAGGGGLGAVKVLQYVQKGALIVGEAAVRIDAAGNFISSIPNKVNFSSAGWYAGYKHELDICIEEGSWMIKDVKFNRDYFQ